MADHIPFEVQAEILKRLPTKSLMRFRSVSKPWKSLIDSPKFIADYSFNHTHQQHLLVSCLLPVTYRQRFVSVVDDDTIPLEKVSLPVPVPGLFMPRLLGSSQGLFALYGIVGDQSTYSRIVKTVHLWNPSIRKSVVIDVSHVIVPYTHIAIGFGVCPQTSDPKLVKINFSVDSWRGTYTPWQVEVYTLSSRVWRSIPTINQPCKPLILLSKQVVISELIYLLAIDGVTTHQYNVIVSFDLTSEGFMEVSLPDTLARAYKDNLVISKLKESLVVVEVVGEGDEQVYDVWMMEHGVSNSFAKVFSINSPDSSIKALLGFWKNNEPIFAMSTDDDVDVDVDVDDVVVQELHSEHKSFIGIYGNGFSYSAHSYTETLLLLDH